MATRKGQRSVFNIGIDAVEALASDLGRLDQQAIARGAAQALNETTERLYDTARDRISAGVNLDDAYLRRRMQVELATTSGLTSAVVAKGDTANLTRLASYNAQMVIVPRTSRAKSRNTGRLGIPQGQKQSGVSVSVMRGGDKTMDGAFLLRLKEGSRQGDKFGVFIRDGDKKKHLYGPSVYQLFRWQAPRLASDTADDLEQTLLARVSEQMKDLLS